MPQNDEGSADEIQEEIEAEDEGGQDIEEPGVREDLEPDGPGG